MRHRGSTNGVHSRCTCCRQSCYCYSLISQLKNGDEIRMKETENICVESLASCVSMYVSSVFCGSQLTVYKMRVLR